MFFITIIIIKKKKEEEGFHLSFSNSISWFITWEYQLILNIIENVLIMLIYLKSKDKL